MPFHNEAEAVTGVISDWLSAGDALGVLLRVVACEDGSTDETRLILQTLALDRPVLVVSSEERKGYSQAVVDGMRATTAPWVATVDGDGQFFPEDLRLLVELRSADKVIIGVRSPRQDSFARKLMSDVMAIACWAVHRLRLADMSSPFNLMPGDVAREIASVDPHLPQGYWWEFHIRRNKLGVGVVEVPVRHRDRSTGETRVYLPKRIVPIALIHMKGLWRLRSAVADTASLNRARQR